jgi:hypothetical protein
LVDNERTKRKYGCASTMIADLKNFIGMEGMASLTL